MPHAVFPHGSGFSEPVPCPSRGTCAWFAAHDLGGRTEFTDFPKGAQITAAFHTEGQLCERYVHVRQLATLPRRHPRPNPEWAADLLEVQRRLDRCQGNVP